MFKSYIQNSQADDRCDEGGKHPADLALAIALRSSKRKRVEEESRCGWSGGLEEPGILPLSPIRSLPEYLQGLLGALLPPSLISGP